MMSQAHSTHAHDHDDGAVHAHITPFVFLCGIFAALIVLTVLTVAASYVNFGSANTVIAIVIATMKATLVAVFFMHLRHDKPFHAFVFVMAFVFLGVFMTLVYDDVSTRGRLDPSGGVRVLGRSGSQAPGGLQGEFRSNGALNVQEDRGGGAAGEHGAAGGGEHAPAAH